MSETQNSSFATGQSEDLDTTPPNPTMPNSEAPAKAPTEPGKWEMPKPVFRKTSGKLASSFEKRIAPEMDGQPAGAAESPPVATTQAPSEAAATADAPSQPDNVEPQPELAEVLIPEPMEPQSYQAAPKKRSGSSGLLLMLLGLALVLGIIALILAALYFFVIRPTGPSSLF